MPLRSYQPLPNTLWSRPIKSRASRSDAVQVPWRKVGAQLRWSQGTCTASLRIADRVALAPADPCFRREDQSGVNSAHMDKPGPVPRCAGVGSTDAEWRAHLDQVQLDLAMEAAQLVVW